MRRYNRDYYDNHLFLNAPPRTMSKDVPLDIDPHYSDRRFNHEVGWKAQTVFGPPSDGSGHPGLSYVYSDRLQQWNYTKSDAAWKKAVDSGATPRSARFYEAYLTAYFEKPVELVHMMAGVNCSNGYPYWVAGYRGLPAKTHEAT